MMQSHHLKYKELMSWIEFSTKISRFCFWGQNGLRLPLVTTGCLGTTTFIVFLICCWRRWRTSESCVRRSWQLTCKDDTLVHEICDNVMQDYFLFQLYEDARSAFAPTSCKTISYFSCMKMPDQQGNRVSSLAWHSPGLYLLSQHIC